MAWRSLFNCGRGGIQSLGAYAASCIAMVEPAGRVRLVRRFVFGEADVPIDAKHRSLGISADLRRELRKPYIEIFDQLAHWLAHLGFVLVTMRFEPGFFVVLGKLPEKEQRSGSEWHTRKYHPNNDLKTNKTFAGRSASRRMYHRYHAAP